MNRRTLSTAALGFSVACNVVAIVADLVRGQYGPAGLQSVVIAALALFWTLHAKVLAWYDAQIRVCGTQQKTADLMHATFERQLANGGAEIQVHGRAH